ncbi:a disintegrin and metalloproteinase with thrombospondin motifs 8 [Sarotherodon galilaeus]
MGVKFWGRSVSGLGPWPGLGGLGPGWCVAGVVGGWVYGGPGLAQGAASASSHLGGSSTGGGGCHILQELSSLQELTLQEGEIQERWRKISAWASIVLCSLEDEWMMGWVQFSLWWGRVDCPGFCGAGWRCCTGPRSGWAWAPFPWWVAEYGGAYWGQRGSWPQGGVTCPSLPSLPISSCLPLPAPPQSPTHAGPWGWVSDATSLGTSQALQGLEAYLPPPLPLPVADALRHRCVGGSLCLGMGVQVHTGSLLGGCLSGPGAWGSLGSLRGWGALGLSAWGSVTQAQLAAGGAHGHVTATPPGFCSAAAE